MCRVKQYHYKALPNPTPIQSHKINNLKPIPSDIYIVSSKKCFEQLTYGGDRWMDFLTVPVVGLDGPPRAVGEVRFAGVGNLFDFGVIREKPCSANWNLGTAVVSNINLKVL